MTASSAYNNWLGRMVLVGLRLSIIGCLGFGLGCTDGPMFQLKKLSPWHQREWRRDRELGPTFYQRLEELQLLKQQLADYPPEEQSKWAAQLEQIATQDTSPEMRAQAARALAKIDSPETLRALNAGSTDEVEKVRLAVCEAWAMRSDQQARDMLLSIAKTDESDDVRQAALASLAKFDSPDVRAQLAEALEHKNPAIQQQAVVSLRQITGRDFGGDFDAWKRYLNGENVPEPEPASFTARILESWPLR